MHRFVFACAWCLLVGGGDPAVAAAAQTARGASVRVLYLTHTAAFRHSVLEASHEAMRSWSGSAALDITVSEDPAVITRDGLASFDVVVFFTTGELALDEGQRAALLDFVAMGKGFVGIHSATDTFYEWPEYGRLIGGYFDDHPWHQQVTVTVENTTHPSTRHLGGSFTISDEIYQFRNWARSDVDVLLSLDLTSVDASAERVRRDDGDFALAWTRSYGRGRVFYTALGHEPAVWRDDRFRTHVTEGIRWAAGASESERPPNRLTDRERADGWRLLFDGVSASAWRGFKQSDLPSGWTIEDGALVRTGPGGDIVSRDQFENFELQIDWRIETGGNSGIFFRVSEDADAVWHTAPEFQILDDASHVDGRTPETSSGSNYALHAPARDAAHPVGDWNHVRLVVQGSHVEHWLNGVRIVTYEIDSPEWRALVAGSKFAPYPYGQVGNGHLALQDHGDRVAFRNIKIRPLD